MAVGEIRWVERPAVVVQRATGLPTVLVVPLTSQLDALRFDGTLPVEADPQNGLRRPSVALAFQLTAVGRRHIADRLGSVSKEVLEGIWSALDKLTGR